MDSPQAEAARTLQFIYRGNLYNVDRAHPTLQLGRDDGNDIVILSLFASRIHARVTQRDGRFVLTDLSSNGTFLLAEDSSGKQAAELRLHAGEAVLPERGWLGIGKPASRHGDHSLRFATREA